jgi:hypothetical protein
VNPLCIPLALVLLPAATPPPLTYRFDQVRRTVQRWPGGDRQHPVMVTQGATANSGDTVCTGWGSRALLTVPSWSARFEVYSRSRVSLTAGQPGVLVELQEGRIKAIFDTLVEGGWRERKVAVPGALLAVRGTRYGVAVDGKGRSTLVVFKGVVEVQPTTAHLAPFRVKAGQWSSFAPGLTPKVGVLKDQNLDEPSWNHRVGPHPARRPGPGVRGHHAPKPLPGNNRERSSRP